MKDRSNRLLIRLTKEAKSICRKDKTKNIDKVIDELYAREIALNRRMRLV